MGEPTPLSSSTASSNDFVETPRSPSTPKRTPIIPPPPPYPQSSNLLQPPSDKKKSKTKVFRIIRSVFRSFPIISTPACKIPVLPGGLLPDPHHHHHHHRHHTSGSKVTGTLFGYRRGRVSLSIQESPRCFPSVIIELAIQTNVLQKELGSGMVRIALECEKRVERDHRVRLLDEPLWTMFCNGKKNGYGVKRDALEEDVKVMELLRAVSMGAGVLPGNSDTEGQDGELAYIRAHFERIVGSKDSETLYMISPEGNNGPELSIFFVRV